ncbi:acyltransferase family protein [Nocardioides mangrovicus]|uniref:acyltransferase family protein n=1 Tax=Nocardioides mangrovicus TaxID=2478913 RepID=UPI001314A3B5|nr:acyltransferase family protein [Nocardioides mangrovicus]
MPRRFRPDIEGLRAIAVVSVVVYHAGLGLPGGYVGVDVFFVISGFLITRQLVAAVAQQGIRALPVFYSHRIRRLLPAAVVVVLATVLAARIWAPALQLRSIVTDAAFTTFYGLNYRLAALGTDYQHVGTAASPLQHFWSLAVEEQFYVVWPIVVALALVLGSRRGRAALIVLVVAVVAVSSAYAVVVTRASAPWAYFSLHTRAWELALGALVALAAPALARLPRRLAAIGAWGGIAMIVLSAVRYTDATAFPGYAAWLPVGGAALVVAAGCGERTSAERVLGEPLMQCLGRISYAWYLWHWPMLVLAPDVLGHRLDAVERGAVVWLSLVAALVSFFAVEEPARNLRMPDWRWFATAFALSGTVVAACGAAVLWGPRLVGTGADQNLTVLGTTSSSAHGIDAVIERQLKAGLRIEAAPANLTPKPADASASLPPTSHDGCHAGFTQVQQGSCVYGDTTAHRTVVLFGDSHMEQWQPALDQLGRRMHWRVVSWTKAACPAAALTVQNPSLNRTYTECDTWRAQTISRIRALQPALVLMSQSENVASSSVSPSAFADATLRTIDALQAGGVVKVHYLQDIPIPGTDLPTCVASHLDDVGHCDFERSKAYTYPARHAALAPALRKAGVAQTDPADWFCTSTECPAVVGNVLVYRNDSHMTVPYSRWLAPALRPVLRAAKESR